MARYWRTNSQKKNIRPPSVYLKGLDNILEVYNLLAINPFYWNKQNEETINIEEEISIQSLYPLHLQ